MQKKTLIWQILGYGVIFIFFLFLSYFLVHTVRETIKIRSYIVQSGSMEPSIMTGDLIIIQKQPSYEKNQVITFKDAQKHTITHRIMELQKTNPVSFVTKGDANQSSDTEIVPFDQIVGSVVLVVPKIGYWIRFLQTPWGILLCIVIPGALILYDELRDLTGTLKNKRRH